MPLGKCESTRPLPLKKSWISNFPATTSQGSRCLPQLLWTGKLIPHFLCSGSFHSWGGLSERRDRPWFRGTTNRASENAEPVPFSLLWVSAESGKWTQDYLVAKCIVFVIAKSQRHWVWNPGFSTCYLFPRLWNGYLISSYHKRRSRPVSTGDLCPNTECLLLSLQLLRKGDNRLPGTRVRALELDTTEPFGHFLFHFPRSPTSFHSNPHPKQISSAFRDSTLQRSEVKHSAHRPVSSGDTVPGTAYELCM